MTQGLNKVLIIGYVGREPEMRYTPGGTPVTSFSLATKRAWTASDGSEYQETDWFNVVAWRSLAEFCRQLSKKQHVYVEGRLQTQRWKDDQDQWRYRTEIVADEVIVLRDSRLPETASPEAQSIHRAESQDQDAAFTPND